MEYYHPPEKIMGRNEIHLFELSISCEWLILLLLPNDYYNLQVGEQVIL